MLKNNIKKIVILGVLAFPIICCGKDDSISVKKNNWGITIGIGAVRSNTSVTGKFVNQYNTEEVLSNDNIASFKPGFTIGMNVEYYLFKKNLCIESGINFFTSTFIFTEINFVKQPTVTSENITREEKTTYVTPGYISIPLHIKYVFSSNTVMNRSFIYAGIYTAILSEKNAYTYLKPIDFGLNVGIGMPFMKHVILKASASYGFINIAQKENFTAKTNLLGQITFEYRFR